MRDSVPSRPPAGFTVLELLLAVTIFSIVSVAVFGVFRTGTRAYRDSARDANVLQRSRFIFDMFETDLAQVFYRDETSYNNVARARIEEYQRDYLDAEERDDWKDFERRYGPRDKERDEDDDPSYIGNPFEQGRLIDLQFVGTDSDDQDSITFAKRQRLETGAPYVMWGLARVHYTLDNGVLIRSLETIEANPRSWDGQILEKDTPPQHIIVAEGVVGFDLHYAYWFDNQWYEVAQWESNGRQQRNSAQLLGDYDKEELFEYSRTLGVEETDDWNSMLNDLEDQPLDRLPAYLRLEVSLADPKNPKRITRFERILRVGASQETYVPNERLDEDQQEAEREVRDTENTPVYPGAMRKT